MSKTFTLIDYFKAFHSLKETLKLSAGSQAVYFSILGEFNAARFPEQLSISTRWLMALAGLKSTNAVFESRNVLKNKKLIDFQAQNGVTVYSLATEHLLNTNRTLAEQQLNGGGTLEANPNIRVRDKTEDIKTQDLSSSASSACAGVCAGAFNWNAETEEFLTDHWLNNRGVPVSVELLSYLKFLVEKHGFDWTQAIIREAGDAYGGDYSMPIKWLRECVKRKLEGGDKRGKTRVNRSNVLSFAGTTSSGKGRFDDAPPDTDWFATSGKGRFDDDPDYN